MIDLPDFNITQRWHGIYAKHPDKHVIVLAPQPNCKIVTAPGGAGMTLGFGLGEQTLQIGKTANGCESIECVIFDWAGTMIDYGSRAPAKVFQETFKQSGIEITVEQAREPMGWLNVNISRRS